jgi:ethanolamine transporter EutH
VVSHDVAKRAGASQTTVLVPVAVPVWPAGAAPSYQAATVIAVNLEANAASQALAIDDATPRLSWQFSSSATNVMQTSYRIPVATSAT